MSQTETAKAAAAEDRTETTRSFVRTVKAAARRKYTPEEKIRIVLEGFRRETTVSDLCRREGIKPHSYYSWTKEFMCRPSAIMGQQRSLSHKSLPLDLHYARSLDSETYAGMT